MTIPAYKLAANFLERPGGDYGALRRLAAEHAPFRTAFRVEAAAAAALRAESVYNRSVFAELGEIGMKGWEEAPEIPETAGLESDLALIAGHLGQPVTPEHAAAMRHAAPWFRL